VKKLSDVNKILTHDFDTLLTWAIAKDLSIYEALKILHYTSFHSEWHGTGLFQWS